MNNNTKKRTPQSMTLATPCQRAFEEEQHEKKIKLLQQQDEDEEQEPEYDYLYYCADPFSIFTRYCFPKDLIDTPLKEVLPVEEFKQYLYRAQEEDKNKIVNEAHIKLAEQEWENKKSLKTLMNESTTTNNSDDGKRSFVNAVINFLVDEFLSVGSRYYTSYNCERISNPHGNGAIYVFNRDKDREEIEEEKEQDREDHDYLFLINGMTRHSFVRIEFPPGMVISPLKKYLTIADCKHNDNDISESLLEKRSLYDLIVEVRKGRVARHVVNSIICVLQQKNHYPTLNSFQCEKRGVVYGTGYVFHETDQDTMRNRIASWNNMLTS
jgi:hypothetical protein